MATTSIKVTGNVTEALAALDRLGVRAEQVGKITEDKLGGGARKAGNAFSKLGALGQSWGVPFAGVIEKIGEKMSEAEGGMQKLAGVGKAVSLGLGAGFAVAGEESIKAASKFQSSMELIHTQAGASQAEVDKMSKAVLNLAGKTATAPDELAAGLYHLESAGMHGARALDALKTAALGAKVGHANLEDVTNALNAAIASGIPGVQNLNQAMGALNSIVGAGDMRMQDLAQAMGTGVLATVKGFGLSLNDVGAALATFGDNNIRGADAATQLRLTVEAFAAPAATAKKALAGIGMTTTQLGKDMQSGGLTKALADLHEHLTKAGMAGTKAGELLVNAFGKKAGTGINVLIDQFSRYESKTKEVAAGAGNFTKDVAATQHTLAYQSDQLRASVEALGVKFGEFLIPKLQEVASGTMKVVGWFEKHKKTAEALAVVIGSVLSAAVGAFAGEALGKLWQSLSKAALGFREFIAGLFGARSAEEETAAVSEATGGGFGPVGMAIGLLVPLLYELVTHWKAIWHGMEAVARAIWNDGIKPVFDGIKRVVADVVDWVKAHWKILAAALAVLTGPLGLIGAAIYELWTHWQTVWNGMKAVLSAAWNDVIKPVFGFIKDLAIDPIKLEIQLLETVWSDTFNAIETAVEDAWSVIQPILDAIKTAVNDTIGVVGKVVGTIGHIGGAIGHGLGSIGSFITRHAAEGGWIAGAAGQPIPYIMHGQEYVLSNAMLAGVQPIDPTVLAAVGKAMDNGATAPAASSAPIASGPASAAGQTNNVTINSMTNASAQSIAQQVVLGLRLVGGAK